MTRRLTINIPSINMQIKRLNIASIKYINIKPVFILDNNLG